nr:hypothetical protein [Mucilaginibacter agri]
MLNGFVTVSSNALHGCFSAEFMPIDFQMFRQQLALLIYGLENIAIFEGTMGHLQLRLQECRDHLFEVSVIVCQLPEIGTELNYRLKLAKTDIDKLIDQLDQILDRYTVS